MTTKHKRQRNQLKPSFSELQMIFILSEGNPATLMLFANLLNGTYFNCRFDFAIMCAILDSIGIYGSNITRLFYNYCYGDINTFCALIFDLNDVPTLLKVKAYLNLQ